MYARHVHGDRNWLLARIYAPAQIFADFLVNEEIYLHDISVLFEERHKAVRCYYRSVRLDPANECLSTDYAILRYGDLRLEEHLEFAVFQRLHCVRGHFYRLVEFLTHFRLIYAAYRDIVLL